ncbi:polysaccharide biosynthesis tyrosine autokinase [Thiomicrorhabdus sp. 6S3-12]|uniref:GumC family protein n=1 Tax=Thiomicrorhabdus sp. 6S3-12 TaxID=2819681 RepID=UPI001AAD7807|nr:polysaccharide biosynthesis tyrosine autokinase [Thiomicrorhabdus sp. 6S3-12]MBO1923328.1 polysaccharide biosynthesis tyrosine autokinase [Thiomicrorhabdus sp. 6S3-12]
MNQTSSVLQQTNLNELPQSFNGYPADAIDLQGLWRTLWGRRWTIVSFTLLITVLSILIVSQMEPVYQATVTVQIEQKKSQVVSIEELYGIDQSSEYLNTQFELIKSRGVAERVVRELNLVKHREFDPTQRPKSLFNWHSFVLNWLVSDAALESFDGNLPIASEENFAPDDIVFIEGEAAEQEAVTMWGGLIAWKDQFLLSFVAPPKPMTDSEIFERVVTAFMNRTSVAPVKKSQMVDISVEMSDPHTAALAANKVAESYINSQMDAAMNAATEATRWMNERLVELKEKLSKSEGALQAFKKEKGLIDLDGIVTVSANELSGMNSKLVAAKAARAEAESQYIQVRDTKSQGWEALASIPAVLSHPLIQNFIAEEVKAKSKVSELSERYGSRHPAMKAAQKELESAQSALKLKVEQIVAGIEKNYQVARANEKALARAVWANKAQIKKVAANEYRLNELKREVESNQALYNTFLTRLKETSATSDMQLDVRAHIIDKALTPSAPVKPKKKLIVVTAALLALMLVSGLVLLLKMLNNAFKTTKEVEAKLNLPVLGVLPLVKTGRKHNPLVQLYNKEQNRIYSESVNTLRTGVMLSSLKHDYKKIVVTSSIPGEGKTTTAANLAFAISHMEKTLLIEADMRRPNIGKHLGLEVGAAGLANLLAGTSELEETIYPIDGLDVMPAGNVPPNPLELLMNDRFKTTLDQLSETYQRIIIDSPPVQAVSDALVLGSYADKMIYVIKGGVTPVDIVTKGVGQLLQNNAPLKGVVLNQVDIKKSQKQGDYYGGYYDYYGYSSNA